MTGLVYFFSETKDASRRSSSLRTNADTKVKIKEIELI